MFNESKFQESKMDKIELNIIIYLSKKKCKIIKKYNNLSFIKIMEK